MSDLRDDLSDKEVAEKEQKAIDDKVAYKQGYNDAIKKACNVFCYTGCPQKQTLTTVSMISAILGKYLKK